jgi:hypothetical protein
MSHDAIENMPSESPTPTISSLGSELSFEDIPSPMGAAAPAASRATEHSDMFMEGNMITIQVSCLRFMNGLSELMSHQVEETLFRIPSYFLTQDSAHFASFLADKNANEVMHITDGDISSSSFANLLLVLRPRYSSTLHVSIILPYSRLQPGLA